MAKRVLIVTKDVGEFNVYEPVYLALVQRGISAHVVAEGLSLEKWTLNGYVVQSGSDFKDNVGSYLSNTKPDLILTGLGAPINLGEKFGLIANRLGIKVGYVHDLWGVHKRSSATPGFVCVTDEFDAKLVREHESYTRTPLTAVHETDLVTSQPRVYVTGSPAMDAMKDVTVDLILRRVLDGATPILVLGQDESTTLMIEGLVSSVKGGEFILIPRLHPKFMEREELCSKWLSLLYGAKCKVLFVDRDVSTRSIMRLAKFTVSIYSTGLIEASILGSIPVSWMSNLGRQQMKNALGVETFPLVDINCAYGVQSGEEFRSLLNKKPELNRLPSDGKNTERVVDAIMTELG